jgi:hypothetical protein
MPALGPAADIPVEVDRNILSDGFHHALHRGMLPVLDLDPVRRTTAAIGPIASFRHQAF